MDRIGLAGYAIVLVLALACHHLSRRLRIPRPALALGTGLLLGRAGLDVVPSSVVQKVLPGVLLHVGILLGVLGYRLGRGMLRLPIGTIARRSVPPLSLAAFSLLVGATVLPVLLPDAAPDRSFYRFALPLAFVFAVFPLLALRDLQGRPPVDVGSLFLVAVFLVGAVYSFTPQLLWARNTDPGILWRGPVLVLGESGALGVGTAILFLLLVRRVGLPRLPVAVALILLVAEAAFRVRLWPPFAGLGFGIILGRAGEREWRLPRGEAAVFAEAPFLLLVAATFAPDLFRDSTALPSLLNAVYLAVILLVVRARVPGGRELVTGPGLLFLGLALTVRLDRRMGPISRYAVDFALPAWVLLRLLTLGIERRARRAAAGRPGGRPSGPERPKDQSAGSISADIDP